MKSRLLNPPPIVWICLGLTWPAVVLKLCGVIDLTWWEVTALLWAPPLITVAVVATVVATLVGFAVICKLVDWAFTSRVGWERSDNWMFDEERPHDPR